MTDCCSFFVCFFVYLCLLVHFLFAVLASFLLSCCLNVSCIVVLLHYCIVAFVLSCFLLSAFLLTLSLCLDFLLAFSFSQFILVTFLLGRSTWTYLHTMAQHYPETAPADLASKTRDFLATFSLLYPCEPCALHMQQYIQRHPPTTNSRIELSYWLCQLHNEVNKSQGKPSFDCSSKNLNRRWGDGPDDGSC